MTNTKIMHIVFFNRSFYPDMAATGQLLTELCEGLVSEYGFQVSVVAGPPDHTQNAEFKARFPVGQEQHNGIRILRTHSTMLSKQKAICRFANYTSYFLSSLAAGLYLKKPDIIVSLTDPPIIGLAGLIWARIYDAKFVFWCQDIFPEVAFLLEDFRNNALNQLLDRINRLLLRKADRTVAIGETMKRRLVEIKNAPEEKIEVIHNWADCEKIQPINGLNSFRSRHGLNDKFVVMHSGNIGLSQDVEKMIESARILKDKRDIVFLIIGEGNKKLKLERKAQEWGLANVIFLPYQPKDLLKYSFSAADLFIISLKKGLAGYIVPSKLYGILASGKPFIAAVEPDCEVAIVAKHHKCGVLCPPGDPQALATAIVRLHDDADGLKKMRRRAREAAEIYDRKVAVKSFVNLFSELRASNGFSRNMSRRMNDSNHGLASIFKRAFDLAVSSSGIIFSASLWLLISLAILLEDGWPVFYTQERIGEGGNIFRTWKFRSMVKNAEKASGPVQARENDPRVTKIGRILRSTAMDELPQLVNILKGNMSFVGPRALRPAELEVYGNPGTVRIEEIPGYNERHAVTPGLTGLAQVYLPTDAPRRKKFRYDRLYIEKQSFWLDLRLIFLSFWITFRGKWESRGRKI